MRTPQTASLSLSRNSPAFGSAKILQFTDLQQLNRKPILQEHLRISARICPAAHCFPSDRRGLFAHTHPSRAVAVCLHPYRQARDKSNTDERQNVSPIIRGETKNRPSADLHKAGLTTSRFPCRIILSDTIHPLFQNARPDHPRASKCR